MRLDYGGSLAPNTAPLPMRCVSGLDPVMDDDIKGTHM